MDGFIPKITWRAFSLNTILSCAKKIMMGPRYAVVAVNQGQTDLKNWSSGGCSYCSKNLQALLLNPCSVNDIC